jgi:FG-GAP-like repeat
MRRIFKRCDPIGRRARFGLSAVALVLAGVIPLAAQSNLKSRRDFPVGQHPLAVVADDFDLDGNLDLITANQFANTLSLMKGFGDGTFREIQALAISSRPTGVVLADVNGDGRPDLIAANLIGQDVTVNLAQSLGGFGAFIRSPAQTTPTGLTVGDWNRDGKLDVALVSSAQNLITTMLGNGLGSFGSIQQYVVIGTSPRQIISADFNKDNIADLAVVNSVSNSLQIYQGDGNGVFNLARSLATGAGPTCLAAADFNSDSNLDIAVCNLNSNTVGIYLGTGSGDFAAPTAVAVGLSPHAAVPADLNGDGKLDLAVTLWSVIGTGQVAILNGNGTGGFTAPVTLATGPSPNALAVGDFNRDGTLDVATANLVGDSVSVLRNAGAGAFVVANRLALPSGTFPHGVAVADFNRDNKPDVAAVGSGPNKLDFAFGDGLAGFGAVNSSTNTGITPYAIVSADFNRDGLPDLVVANNGDETLSYLQNNGSNNFTATNGILVGSLCEGTVWVSAGEISGDVNSDIALVCETSGHLCTRRGTGGSGSSAFGASVCTQIGGTPQAVALGNYNLDALNDAAISAESLNVVQIGFSNGAGGLLDIPATFPVGSQPKGVARGDLNGDGYTDLVVTNAGSGTISALLGDGGGAFSFPSIDTRVGLAPTAVALADFNMDGKLDAAVTNTNSNTVSLLLGDGTGHFSDSGQYGTRDLPIAIGAGDFNLDGKPDLAVADFFNDTVTLLLNQTVPGDPLQMASIIGGATHTVFTWGLVPGAVYDLIRGQVRSVVATPTTYDLGAVTCLADDLAVTDSGGSPDASTPPLGDAYFYAVRPVIGGVPGAYTVATNGKPGIPSSGGCP